MKTLQIGLASLIAVSNLNSSTTTLSDVTLSANAPIQQTAWQTEALAATVVPKRLASSEDNSDDKNAEDPEMIDMITKESQLAGIDPTLALSIARCESHLRQYGDSGKVIRGKVNPKDIGLFQINEEFHLVKSQQLGFNIYTAKGNIDYAMHLLKSQGSKPWIWSKPCWSKLV